MLTKPALFVALGAAALAAIAQPSADSPFAPPPNGPRHAEPTAFAITGATVHTAPGEVSPAATVLMRDGKIERVISPFSSDAVSLDGYRIIDGEGLHLYPGFIDAWVQVESPNLADAPGRHPSPVVQPERDVLAGAGLDKGKAEKLRKLGFAAAAISPTSGIFRGMGAVVSTAEPYTDDSMGRTPVYAGRTMDVMGFASGPWGSDGHQMNHYPNSHMGMMALIRQTYLDADHWDSTGPHANTTSFDAVNPGEGRPTFWNVSNTLQWMLADKVFSEFKYQNLVIVGAGDEYQRLDTVTGAGHAVVVPLRFPAKPDLSTINAMDSVSLSQLQAWEQAPTNPRLLKGAGLTVAITSSKLPEGAKFHDNMRRAIDQGGLSADDALAMLTTVPASLLGVSDTLGTIEPGKAANLVVTDRELFGKKTKLLAVWVDGREHTLHKPDEFPLNGKWQLRMNGNTLPLGFTFDDKKITSWETGDEDKQETTKGRKNKVNGGNFSLLLDQNEDEGDGVYVVSGTLQANGEIVGSSYSPSGDVVPFSMVRVETTEKEAGQDAQDPDAPDEDADNENDGNNNDEEEEVAKAPELIPAMPAAGFGPYAVAQSPAQNPVLITGATLWTSGPEGIIENGYLYASGGKIIAVGKANPDGTVNYQVPDTARRIDGSGMHLTPGLIDTHSHTGLFQLGVNESGQAITAECQIADALDPGAINWYRQIAGGVTTAQLLHGSANAIGGQSQVVKPRWGESRPEAYYLEGAKLGIKFALGENPRGANWDGGDRYPKTRMGVEALIRDRLTAGKAYAANGMRTPDGRVDLELQAIAEIINGDRMIHCHSYRQDEILMLCNMASEFGITIGTFQHGLEVYKVAEAVQANAIGASIFADWWAYKLEVQDAIAQGGPVASEAGVLMSYNSDSDDLARRMNLEAAKAAKYSQGRISKEEALKFVTINPAIQLGLGNQIGSLEPGKDADFALWNGDPLSAFSKCEATFIDGREYFSTAADLAHREHNNTERQRLITKIIAAPDKGEDKKKDEAKDDEGDDDKDTETPNEHAHPAHNHLTSGSAPTTTPSMSPGDCGCETPPVMTMEIR